LVTFDKRVHRGASAVLGLPTTIDRRSLFGSGYAGL